MKFSTTMVLLVIASYAFAQNISSNSGSTKISEKEKKHLENQFKALNNFYISEDGLVVYNSQDNQPSQSQGETQTTNSNSKHSESQNTKPKERGGQSINTESPKQRNIQPTNINKTNNSSTVIRKSASTPTNNYESQDVEENRGMNMVNTTSSTESTKKEDTAPAKSSTKKSVFDKKTKASQYKNLEEAALAVENLLDELHKQQSQATSTGSMSSRLSGGAGRSTLRKKPMTDTPYNSSSSNTNVSTNQNSMTEDESTQYNNEPTYYINGNEVDKIEVNRLRKSQIISKEVRTRNTVSGNPNGEVWYEVKQ